jgi:hypothetical protein
MNSTAIDGNVCYREMHPGWEYRLWTDAENRELVQEHYPWLLDTYDRLPENIMRADTARILYMHQFGGGLSAVMAPKRNCYIESIATTSLPI